MVIQKRIHRIFSLDVGFTADLLAEIEEFMGAKVVVFCDAAPVGVDHGWAFFARSDAVFPVVFIGETAAGPA